jgi:hypothetical protein
MLYENNLRSVASAGVDVVMESFFEQHGRVGGTIVAPTESGNERAASSISQSDSAKAYCDEEVLEAFAR